MMKINFAESIDAFRNHVPVTKKWAYLETASTGLIPDFVHDGVRRYEEARYRRGGNSVWQFEEDEVETLEMIERSKEAIAQMIHGTKEEIAFGQSSTQLFTLVTEGIDYGQKDNVITIDKGWIGNRYAWQKKEDEGLEVRYVTPRDGVVRVEDIIAYCDENTRAITVNLVENTTGFLIDINRLGAFCRKHDILLFVDAVQALGVLQVDVKKSHIDFLVGNDYKWMMNYCGTGYAYISPKVQRRIRHWGAGWMSDTDRFCTEKLRLNLRRDAGRFEIGYPHADGIYGLGLAAKQYELLGGEAIQQYTVGLADYFRQRVDEIEGLFLTYHFSRENLCQIVSVSVDESVAVDNGDFEKARVFAHLQERTGKPRKREIRVGFHYYNNKEDIERFFAVIEEAKK